MNDPISLARHRNHDLFARLERPTLLAPRPCPIEVEPCGPRTDLDSVMRFIATRTAESSDIDKASTVLGNDSDKARGNAIEAFLGEYTLRVPGAPPFVVPFRMVQGGEDLRKTTNALIEALGGKRAPEASVAGWAVIGRARPDEMRKVVFALAARHPDRFITPDRARAYLRSLSVGMDCAGFVQLALSHVDGGTRPPFGLLDRGMENLARLGSNNAFRRVASPRDARPGDVITLKSPAPDEPGHTVIVTRCATTTGKSLVNGGVDLLSDDRVVLLRVASSWGGGRGPQQTTWTYNERTQRWGMVDETTGRITGSANPGGPYDHALDGIYHPRWRTNP